MMKDKRQKLEQGAGSREQGARSADLRSGLDSPPGRQASPTEALAEAGGRLMKITQLAI
jgi:hypothetical protein